MASSGNDNINDSFAYHELRQALQQCKKNSSPGQDSISYEILKEIPKSSVLVILNLFNLIWSKGTLPNSWKESFVTSETSQTK